MQLLPGNLLKHQGWEVLNLSEHEFDDWKQNEKVDQLKGWLTEAKNRQLAKGVFKEYKKNI